MRNSSSDSLNHLLALAREYDEKQRKLQELCETEDLSKLIPQFIQRVELATDRFRGAQQVLFQQGNVDQDRDQHTRSLHTVSRCFDEVLILFHALIDKIYEDA